MVTPQPRPLHLPHPHCRRLASFHHQLQRLPTVQRQGGLPARNGRALEAALNSTAPRRDDEAAVTAMTVEMWERLREISERDGGIAMEAFNQLVDKGRISMSSEMHRGLLYGV